MATTKKKKQVRPKAKNNKSSSPLANFVDHLHPVKKLRYFWQKSSRFTRIMVGVFGSFLLFVSILYSFAVYYRVSNRNEPLQWGMSWSFKYADELGINPYEGLEAVAQDFDIERLRLMTYWDIHEPERGVYDWDDLDFQIDVAEANDLEVSLAIGLRQPRWPECHTPSWAVDLPRDEWLAELNKFMGAILERYDSRDIVVEYQLENEFTLTTFGQCPDHDRERLIEEFNYVRERTDKTIIVSHGGTFAPTWPVKAPRADKTAMSIYKRVYDSSVTRNFFEYPYPAWYYGSIAGMTKLHTGVETFIHELQAEPWGKVATVDMTNEEQLEQMDARRLKARLGYAEGTGMKTIDVWGAEWYYWRKTQFNDPSLWQTVVDELPKYE